MALSDKRILALRALGLGDLLTGVPALRALRAASPGQELLLACPTALHPLAELAEVCDAVVAAPGLSRVEWSGPPPSVAVNLHGRGPESHRLLARLSPGAMIAFGSAAADVAGPAWRAEEHEVRRWCRLLEEAMGIPTDPRDLRLRAPQEQAATVPGSVVVHPGAAFPARRWPAPRFASVARWAAGEGHPVVVTGVAEERTLAEEVAEEAGLPPGAVRAGETDLLGLADQVARARLVICGDTGTAHLATAFGTPSVLLFGPTPPTHWGPLTDGPHTVLWRGGGAGDPHGRTLDPALAAISSEEVVAAAERLLADGSLRQAAEV